MCGPVEKGFARCDAIHLDDPSTWHGSHVTFQLSAAARGVHRGYSPADLQSAYALATSSANGGQGKTVAVVAAYDDPKAESDLAVYRSTEGLPALCGTAHAGTSCVGSFQKLNQSGGTTFPTANAGWAGEISLDVDMVSAICPQCSIVLVEANSSLFTDLGAAENEAAGAGAFAISNSYGGSEFPGEITFDSTYYSHLGVAITASSGDQGFGGHYPAASPDVTAVGGTSLINSGSPGAPNWNEAVWKHAGSACSTYEPAPSWQFLTSICSHRTVADIAAVADPKSGVAFYDTYKSRGWGVAGGTSVAAPIIAAVYALAGSGTTPSSLYALAPSLRRVRTGANSTRCKTYLCSSAHSLSTSYTFNGQVYNPTWYNGPTGNGTPQGTGSF
jgi:subtilase family serine protease